MKLIFNLFDPFPEVVGLKEPETVCSAKLEIKFFPSKFSLKNFFISTGEIE